MLDDVSSYMGLTQDVRSIPHGNSGRTEVEYRMAWARTYLKKAGAIENSSRGVWHLTSDGLRLTAAEVNAIPKQVQGHYGLGRKTQDRLLTGSGQIAVSLGPDSAIDDWSSMLLQRVLILEPAQFERLCQRLLREAGFTRVEVTGKSGDGGIDGTGVLRVNLLSFQVIFQCKRWQGSVGASVVRDFRGAMIGRADKGLILTTGYFTADARREATRDGAPAIDLVDGEALCQLLKDHRIGVAVEMVESVTLDERMFASL